MTKTIQKTWTDLLGPFNRDCKVVHGQIVAPDGLPNMFRVLWTFDCSADATAALDAWRAEGASA